MRKFKTSKSKRNNYVYYSTNRTKTILTPGEDGITEALIETLHQLDDEEVDNNRRETRKHSSIDDLNDKSKYLKDIYVDVQDEAFSNVEREAIKKIVHEVLEELKPQQSDLINELYLSDNPMTQAEYAEKLGIRESSVSQKAWRTKEKIKKLLENKNDF
mgnify:CR=1 FL=1